jgi:hypothetical protein
VETSATVGGTLYLQAFASDIDGDSPKFSAIAEVSWSDILDGHIPDFDMDGRTGEFRFTPAGYDAPDR